MPDEKELLATIEQHATDLVRAAGEAKYWHTVASDSIETDYSKQIAANEERHVQALATINNDYADVIEQIRREDQALTAALDYAAAPWSDVERWRAWTPHLSVNVAPEAVRAGTLVLESKWRNLVMPALLPAMGDQALLFKVSGYAKQGAADAIQSLLLRLLAVMRPGNLHFTFIDPLGLGQNVATFMPLRDHDDLLVTSRAWTEQRHIEQRLTGLTEHMEDVIQGYLRNEFATIREYNAQARVPEPYRLLVVYDFPANFSEDAARRLISIAQNGPRCGVHTIVLYDTERPLPYGFSVGDLERASTIISHGGKGFIWEEAEFDRCRLTLDALPEFTVQANGKKVSFVNHVVNTIGEAARDANRVEVPFAEVALDPSEWWTHSASGDLRVPLGPRGATANQHIQLGKGTAIHALVAGRTGSGKSTLLHVLITNAALAYSPEELQLYLIDFKKGVEFKVYAEHQLPHARVIAIESEREFGLSVLQGLNAELKRRGDLFRGQGVDGLPAYRQATGTKVPRILLLVDEFQEFFSEDDSVASQASQLLDRLVRQGRAFGIHVLLGSQTLAGAYSLARSTIEQMYVRIALQCSDADSRLILGEDNAAARTLTRPGEAIYNDANGLVEGNERFQVAWLSSEDHEHYLGEVQRLAEQHEDKLTLLPQIIFEGNAPAHLENNELLDRLLKDKNWPQPGPRRHAWLGEPVAIKDPTAAILRRQAGANLLMVGQNPEAALGIMTSALISLAAQHTPGSARFYLLDFTPVDDPNAGYLKDLADQLPHDIQRGKRRQLSAMIDAIAAEINARLDEEEVDLGRKPTLYLLIFGLQRARDLRPQDAAGFGNFSSYDVDFDAEPPPPRPDQQFPTILREGPDLGVHTLVWCDTGANLERTLDWQSLREFEMRVVFQMGNEDSTKLVDSPAASKLGSYRALYYSEDDGRLEKFRPYSLPSPAWLTETANRLSERASDFPQSFFEE